MKYTMKKTIAFLLTLVMLVNILPVSVLAEQPDEGRRGPLNAPAANETGHSVEVIVGNNVNFSRNTYAVFMQPIGGLGQGVVFWYQKIDPPGFNDVIIQTLKKPYKESVEFDSNKELTVVIAQAWNNDFGSNPDWLFQMQDGKPNIYNNNNMLVVENNGTIDGENVSIQTDENKTKTTIIIGGVPTYSATLKYTQSDGENATDARPEGKYFVIATKNGDVNTKYVAQLDNGVLDFGLPDGEQLPQISEFKVYRYDAGNINSSASDIEQAGTYISDGGELGDNTLFTIVYPSENPENNNYVFKAIKIDTYTGATIQFYSDPEGTIQENSPDTASNYYLVAYDGASPVAYASITGNGELHFVDDGEVVLRSTYTYKLKQYPRRSTELDDIANDANNVDALNNYHINLTPTVVSGNNGDSLLFKATAIPTYPATFTKNGNDSIPEGYYFIAVRNGQVYAYTEIPDGTSDLIFTDGTNTYERLPEDSSFKAVHYEGNGTPTLDELANLSAVYSIDGIDLFVPDSVTGTGENANFEFFASSVNPMEEIHIIFRNEEGEIANPTPNPGDKYYVRIKVQRNKNYNNPNLAPEWEDYGWQLLKVNSWDSTGETVLPFSTFVPLNV